MVCEFHLNKALLKKREKGTSLVAQWLRTRLPVQGTRVRALIWEDQIGRAHV